MIENDITLSEFKKLIADGTEVNTKWLHFSEWDATQLAAKEESQLSRVESFLLSARLENALYNHIVGAMLYGKTMHLFWDSFNAANKSGSYKHTFKYGYRIKNHY